MPKNKRQDETTVQLANSKTRSMRTTIPMFIANQFELKKGDKLRWAVQDVEEKTFKIMIIDG